MQNNSTNADLVIYAICFVLTLAVIGLYAADYIVNGPEPTEKVPTYTTADGRHHGCSLEMFPGIIHSTTWKLTCPDGYIQHNGNYTKEQ